jgi:hypothetical protein
MILRIVWPVCAQYQKRQQREEDLYRDVRNDVFGSSRHLDLPSGHFGNKC